MSIKKSERSLEAGFGLGRASFLGFNVESRCLGLSGRGSAHPGFPGRAKEFITEEEKVDR
jgi:hypothetical protein